MTDRVERALLAWQDTGKAQRIIEAAPSQREASVFGIGDTIKTAWAGALRDANLKGIRFHDARRTCSVRLGQAGVSDLVRQTILGHSPGSPVTGLHYAPVTPEVLADVRSRLNGRS